MRQELSMRTVALIAVGLAVGPAVFCRGWSSRYAASVERQSREMLAMQDRHEEMEHRMLNIAALVLMSQEGPLRVERFVQGDPRFTTYFDMSTSPLFQSMERGRAKQALARYCGCMTLFHHSKAGDEGS